MTAGKGFRREIDMNTIENESETGERGDRETGTEMWTKTGQGAGSARDSGSERGKGRKDGSWRERETDSCLILLKETGRERELLTSPLKRNQQSTVKQNWTEITKRSLMVFAGTQLLQRRKKQTKI